MRVGEGPSPVMQPEGEVILGPVVKNGESQFIEKNSSGQYILVKEFSGRIVVSEAYVHSRLRDAGAFYSSNPHAAQAGLPSLGKRR